MCKDARIVSEVQPAESLDMSLGDLLEGIVLASFEANSPFVASTREKIEQLKEVYGMESVPRPATA